ncbi:hypothetical protein RB653_004009 [Dictyostelium firmibasis]|uniref:B box-type domain-containing protein n=1 Tax=Dictyostelium firmibasis TaxID=79012 RepID=A0AAN7YS12_9MYCE
MENNKGINCYDIKCILHEHKYRFICSTCNIALCDLCIASVDHRGHEINLINKESTAPVIKEFKDKNFGTLTECSNKIQESYSESDKIFNKIEEEHTRNINTITNEFKQLYTILQTIEKDTIRQLVTHFDDNKEINTNISTLSNSYLQSTYQIQNKYKDLKTIDFNIEQLNNNDTDIDNNNNNNNNYNKIKTNKNLEILKHCHQTKLFLKEITSESKVDTLMSEYKKVIIENSAKKFMDSIKDIIKINLEPEICKDPIEVMVGGNNFFIYKEGREIPYNTRSLALGPGIKNLGVGLFPNSIIHVVLLDGFSVQLTRGMLPDSVLRLYIGAIKKPLLKDSLPQYITTLFLMNDFNQEIFAMPPSITQLYVVKSPIVKFPHGNYTIYTQYPSKHSVFDKVSHWIPNIDYRVINK